ncbi:unnamed protein product, partial [Linum tenue]
MAGGRIRERREIERIWERIGFRDFLNMLLIDS